MYITARLVQNNNPITRENIKLGDEYQVLDHLQQRDIYGDKITIIAGPHDDFGNLDVFTCQVHIQTSYGSDFYPFFNAGNGYLQSAVVYVTQ